eukprot:s18152_g1.t1
MHAVRTKDEAVLGQDMLTVEQQKRSIRLSHILRQTFAGHDKSSLILQNYVEGAASYQQSGFVALRCRSYCLLHGDSDSFEDLKRVALKYEVQQRIWSEGPGTKLNPFKPDGKGKDGDEKGDSVDLTGNQEWTEPEAEAHVSSVLQQLNELVEVVRRDWIPPAQDEFVVTREAGFQVRMTELEHRIASDLNEMLGKEVPGSVNLLRGSQVNGD